MSTVRYMDEEEAWLFIRKMDELVFKVSHYPDGTIEVEYCAPCCDGCEHPYVDEYNGPCENTCNYFKAWTALLGKDEDEKTI